MGGDCGTWSDQQYFDGQSPDFNSIDARIGQYMWSQNQLPSFMYPWSAPITTGQDLMLSPIAKPTQPHFDHSEPHGWFYCLSTFRQAMFPPSLSVSGLKEHLSAESPASSKKDENHNAAQQFHPRQLLVFDQTGDQTTMIYSPGAAAPPVRCHSQWNEKQAEASIFRPWQNGSTMIGNAATLLVDDCVEISEFDEDRGSDLQSEMHEDTEELNALMYSDDDTDSDDDEVTSTAHSPYTLTARDKLNGFAEIRKEVASSEEAPTKRQKMWNGVNDDHITAGHGTFNVDSGSESHCCSAKMCNSGKTLSLFGKKRARKDSIRETVRTLQSMIPCENDATPIEVIDGAIHFLLSLKLKAKALGFDSST